MFFSSPVEESMILTLLKYDRESKQPLIFEFKGGLALLANIYTFYDCFNDKDLDEEGYVEYHACVIDIKKVLKRGLKRNKQAVAGKLFELGYETIPLNIKLDKKHILWSAESSK